MKAYLIQLAILVIIVSFVVYLHKARLENFLTYVFVPRWKQFDGKWRPVYKTYLEHFENLKDQQAAADDEEAKEEEVYQYRPDMPDKANLDINKTYTLLQDVPNVVPLPAPGSIGCVNSQSCYESEFSHLLEQGGNFRQTTNNFKHEGPSTCTTWYQELVGDFYKTPGLTITSAPAKCL